MKNWPNLGNVIAYTLWYGAGMTLQNNNNEIQKHRIVIAVI